MFRQTKISTGQYVEWIRLIIGSLISVSVSIVAIIIGIAYKCDYNDDHIIINPTAYLITGGCIGLFSACCICVIFTLALDGLFGCDCSPKGCVYGHTVSYGCFVLFDIIWLIIGIVLFTQLSWKYDDCQNSKIIVMILIDIIVRSISIGYRILLIIFAIAVENSTIMAQDDTYFALHPVSLDPNDAHCRE